MGSTIKVGILGCGRIANRHVMQFSEVEGVEVAALCDPETEGIERLYEEFPFLKGLPVFTDYRKMFDEADLDVISINTPHTLHFKHIMDSLERGLHVGVEKPMTCCVDDAKQVIAKSEETGKLVSVTYQRRFWPEFRYIRQFIDNGDLGAVKFVSAVQCQGWFNPMRKGWRQTKALGGGGQLNDSGSHMIDSLLFSTNLIPEEVFAYIDNRGGEVDINSAICVKFEGGAQANISIMGDAPTKGVEEQINISGEKGVILYHNKDISFFDRTRTEHKPQALPEGGNPDANLIDAIRGKAALLSPPTVGLRVIELTEAVWKSAETGCPVRISR